MAGQPTPSVRPMPGLSASPLRSFKSLMTRVSLPHLGQLNSFPSKALQEENVNERHLKLNSQGPGGTCEAHEKVPP